MRTQPLPAVSDSLSGKTSGLELSAAASWGASLHPPPHAGSTFRRWTRARRSMQRSSERFSRSMPAFTTPRPQSPKADELEVHDFRQRGIRMPGRLGHASFARPLEGRLDAAQCEGDFSHGSTLKGPDATGSPSLAKPGTTRRFCASPWIRSRSVPFRSPSKPSASLRVKRTPRTSRSPAAGEHASASRFHRRRTGLAASRHGERALIPIDHRRDFRMRVPGRHPPDVGGLCPRARPRNNARTLFGVRHAGGDEPHHKVLTAVLESHCMAAVLAIR